ncbi:MAG: hypothetical protein WC657_02775 [Candidatus Paceibacterota bacterium]|jgi:hypothetical protein
MALTNQDRALKVVKKTISQQPSTIIQKIEEGEKIIDEALTINGWFNTDHGLQVFSPREKIPHEVHDLLQRLYNAAGYCVHWKTSLQGLTNIIVMHGR